MEIVEVYKIVQKRLEGTNTDLGFETQTLNEDNVVFSGEKGSYRLKYDNDTKTIAFECAYNEEEDFKTISRSLFELDVYEEKDAKSLANEIDDEVKKLFKAIKKVDLDKVKMPKAVSRTKAKNGIVSYDVDSLANRFGVLYPDMKDNIKLNIATYGEFLPETFFDEYGTQRVLDVIKNGSSSERSKLFKALNEIYEDGTNEVQDIIGVTILGQMKNDPDMMSVAKEYMSDYMAGPVEEINKLLAKKKSLNNKLANPPIYKPKKNKKATMLANALPKQ